MTHQIRVALPPLHSAQRMIHDNSARFRVAACGRRFGKNYGAVIEQLESLVRGAKSWHVAPDYPSASVHWRLLKGVASQIPSATISESDRMIALEGLPGFIQVKSAGATLRSEGLDFLTVDEAGHIPDLRSIWQEALRPALSDRQGRALFISSPNGLDFFYDLFMLGQNPHEVEWWSICLPSSANPHIPASEIEAARKSLPDRVFRQEYLAEFISDGAGVFRFVRETSILNPQVQPDPEHVYVFGVDWGRSHDFTSISIFDCTTRQQAQKDRFTGIGWQLQRERLIALYQRWNPRIILAEENSIGSPNIEALSTDGLPMRPFVTSAASKAALIDALSLAIEKGHTHEDGGILLLDDDNQVGELTRYSYERLPSGVYRYGAPSGGHDDDVISLALSLHAAGMTATHMQQITVKGLWPASESRVVEQPADTNYFVPGIGAMPRQQTQHGIWEHGDRDRRSPTQRTQDRDFERWQRQEAYLEAQRRKRNQQG